VNGDGYADVIIGAPDCDYRGVSALSVFDSENAQGEWTLFVQDLASADTGTLNSWSLELEGYGTVSLTDTPVVIPDNDSGGITSIIIVTDEFIVSDLNVPLNITHTWRSDLVVEITSPAGSMLRLHNRTGGSEDDIQWTYDDEGAHPPDGEEDEGAAFVFLGSASGLQGRAPGDTGVWMAASNQAVAYFGYSVSGAGDVNGDGYADVIVGAAGSHYDGAYDNGEEEEGAAFVFLGSESGLQGNAPGDTGVWMAESNQASAHLGYSVSGAGDVNGDGYADVIVGAPYYNNGEEEEGAAFVFLGSASGLQGNAPGDTGVWMAESNQVYAYFGCSVSGAGDVNGDGYADVIVGADEYDNREQDEGAAFMFLGSASGLQGNAPGDTGVWMAESNQATDFYSIGIDPRFGRSVSGAGDVNGDGYADVIVGADGYDNGESEGGAAFVFLGSASGLQGNAPGDTGMWMAESNQVYAYFGCSVSGAGDVNGDGYADVIVGAPEYDNGETGEGAAFVFLGGNAWGMTQDPAVLAKPDGSYVATPGLVWDTDQVRLTLADGAETDGWTSDGPVAIRLEWEIKPWAVAFDGTGLGRSMEWYDPADGTVSFDELISIPGDVNGWHWRARVLHLPLNLFQATGTPGPVTAKSGIALPPNPPGTRWHRPQWATVGPSDFRTSGYLPPTNPGGVEVTQTPLTTTDDIICTINTPSTSPALPTPKPIEYEYTWTNEGTPHILPEDIKTIVHMTSSETDTLDSSETLKHDVWKCVVRAWDGVQFSHGSSSDIAPEIGNTEPSQPTIRWEGGSGVEPNEYGPLDTLKVQIAGQYDADNDGLVPEFRWQYYRGADWHTQETDISSTSLSSWVAPDVPQPGDAWRCKARHYDGEAWGGWSDPVGATILATGIDDLFITIAAAPETVTLGEGVTITGGVNPAASLAIGFKSKMPGDLDFDRAFPGGVTASAGAFSKFFIPDAASEGLSNWRIKAVFNGNETFRPTESNIVSFAVLKAQPALTLELSHTSALLNLGNAESFAATATLSVENFPTELSQLLAGRTIRLSLAFGPNNETPYHPLETTTDENGVAEFSFAGREDWFNQAGVWKFKAEFAGDDNLTLASSPDFDDTDARLIIKEGAGYAVVVLGRLDQTAEGHDAHAKTTDYIYTTLEGRAFDPSDIYYMREVLPGETVAEDIDVHDTSPTRADVQYAIETWAYDKMFASPAPLYLIFADHGSVDKFHLWSAENTEEDQYLTPAELQGYLAVLESQLEAGGVSNPEIAFIYGACHAGSYIPAVSAPNRVIITSCAADEISYRGVTTDESDVRDGEFFLMEFFREAGAGKSLRQAFEQASERTVGYTATKSSGVLAEEPQHPLLDDNGDGEGTAGASSGELGADGDHAWNMVLGLGSNAGNTVSWFTASPPLVLDSGGTIPAETPLFAETTGRALTTDDEAWIEIKPPEYDGGEYADPDYQEFQRLAEMAGPILPGYSEAVGEEKVRFEWAQADLEPYLNFDTPGTYKVYYFLKDGETGQVSAYLVTNVYVAKADNRAPEPVALVYPADGATVFSTVFFAWEETTDPDGDAVSYRLEVSEDSAFPAEGTIVRDGIPGTVTRLTEEDGIEDLHIYYWRVIPADEYGASPENNSVRTCSVDNANPPFPGLMTGMVEDSETGDGIGGASVTLTPGPLTMSSTTRGAYFFANLWPRAYTVQVSATGYESQSKEDVTVAPGDAVELNFQLMRIQTNSDGDVNGDDTTNAIDVQLVINAALGLSVSWDCDVDGNGVVNAISSWPGRLRPWQPWRYGISALSSQGS